MNFNQLVETYRQVGSHVTLVMGGAGSGKSHLIGRIVASAPESTLVVSPTGISALNLQSMIEQRYPTTSFGGVSTVHSAFGFGIGLTNQIDVLRLSDQQIEAIRMAKRLIVDEVSMVRLDILDRLSNLLTAIRGCWLPFGGLFTVLVGDPFQLPPVVPEYERWALERMYGRRISHGYFFESNLVRTLVNHDLLMIFEKVDSHRQQDAQFLRCLQSLRLGQCTPEVLSLLESRVDYKPKIDPERVHLTVDRETSRTLNGFYLDNLDGVKSIYIPKCSTLRPEGEEYLQDHPMNRPIALKVGSRVLMTKNDTNRFWRNGSRGTVLATEPSRVVVRLESDEDREVVVTPQDFEIPVPVVRPGSSVIKSEVVARVRQLPLLGGNAMTIHRSQSLTLDKVTVGFGRGVTTPGQAYTALSRVRRLEDLVLLARPLPQYFSIPPVLQQFMSDIRGSTHHLRD